MGHALEKEISRRREERYDVKWDAIIHTDSQSFIAKISNVSLGGTLCFTDAPLENGTEVLLEIEKLGEFAGEVVWADKPYFGLTLMGGPDLDLKRFTHAEGQDVSISPDPSGDDWV